MHRSRSRAIMFRRTRKCTHAISTYDKAMELNNKLNLQGCDCLPNYYDWLFAAKDYKTFEPLPYAAP